MIGLSGRKRKVFILFYAKNFVVRFTLTKFATTCENKLQNSTIYIHTMPAILHSTWQDTAQFTCW
jgi:hypothetical protein